MKELRSAARDILTCCGLSLLGLPGDNLGDKHTEMCADDKGPAQEVSECNDSSTGTSSRGHLCSSLAKHLAGF